MSNITRDAVTGFDLLAHGHIYPIARDVATEHTQDVHDALGTADEIALQAHLDAIRYDDFFAPDGSYLGRDTTGLGLVAE